MDPPATEQSEFLSLPKHLTRDHVSGLIIGIGLGILWSRMFDRDLAVPIGFAIMIVGFFIRPKACQ